MTPILKDILARLDVAIGDWQVGYELLELVGGEDDAPDS